MIAINHMGYVAGLVVALPEKAIPVATGFLFPGLNFFVHYGDAEANVM